MSRINFQGESEQSLMAALQEGRQDVLGLLYDAYAPVLLGVISRIVPDEQLAEEALQETFVAIWTRIKLYDASKNRFLIWGMAIARGVALEVQKRNRYQQLVAAQQPEAALRENLQLCKLEPQEQEAMELVCLKGLSCEEAAVKLGITSEALRLKIKEAFHHLRAERSA